LRLRLMVAAAELAIAAQGVGMHRLDG
jgi:hypothetical protein